MFLKKNEALAVANVNFFQEQDGKFGKFAVESSFVIEGGRVKIETLEIVWKLANKIRTNKTKN